MIFMFRLFFVLITVALVVLVFINLKTINGAQGLVVLAALYAGIGQITTWADMRRRRRVETLVFHPQQGRKTQ